MEAKFQYGGVPHLNKPIWLPSVVSEASVVVPQPPLPFRRFLIIDQNFGNLKYAPTNSVLETPYGIEIFSNIFLL